MDENVKAVRVYFVGFNFILGLNFIFICFGFVSVW